MSLRLDHAQGGSATVRRLWIFGGGWALFILSCVVANSFAPADKQVTTRSAGHDYLAFYTAGTFVRQGRLADLYKVDAVRNFEQQVAKEEQLELGKGYGPYWNPPVFAWIFVPLAKLGYTRGWWVWFGINVLCAAGAMALLSRMLIESAGDMTIPRWKVWGLVPVLVGSSMPFIMALGHGQNTCISFLILTGVVWFWRKSDAIKAGILCGLLVYKPQLAAVIAGMLVLTLGYRAMLGLVITGIVLLGTSALTMPGAMQDWTHRLPQLVKYMQVDHRYMWERHVTLKAFWRLLLMGYAAGNSTFGALALWVVSVAVVALGMTWALLKTMFNPIAEMRPRRWDRLIAATIVTMPLLMPFYFDYDLLLLAIPAVLYAMDRTHERWTTLAWVAVFAWIFANPFVAGQTHINGTVLLLCGLSGMLITRTCLGHHVTNVERHEPIGAAMAA